jgi:hypothetical protein
MLEQRLPAYGWSPDISDEEILEKLLARISHQRRVEGRIFWYKWLSESHLEAREETALNARLYFSAF